MLVGSGGTSNSLQAASEEKISNSIQTNSSNEMIMEAVSPEDRPQPQPCLPLPAATTKKLGLGHLPSCSVNKNISELEPEKFQDQSELKPLEENSHDTRPSLSRPAETKNAQVNIHEAAASQQNGLHSSVAASSDQASGPNVQRLQQHSQQQQALSIKQDLESLSKHSKTTVRKGIPFIKANGFCSKDYPAMNEVASSELKWDLRSQIHPTLSHTQKEQVVNYLRH